MHHYNENDTKAAAWLRELMKAGEIPEGRVDERSIADVRSNDLHGAIQCHFFAGIGGWSYALRLAGWPADRPVWTGSCPCQPFSAAGKQRGTDDERHLWPEFLRLIAECRPPTIFGEQVASKLGREWIAGIRTDLESLGYAVGAADLCAASVGAPHIRQRLFWMADAEHDGRRTDQPGRRQEGREVDGRAGGMVNADGNGRSRKSLGQLGTGGQGHWSRYAIVPCLDGKARRFEPESFPLAHGFSGRVGLLRGYGNAIVPQVAAEFVKAFLNCEGQL